MLGECPLLADAGCRPDRPAESQETLHHVRDSCCRDVRSWPTAVVRIAHDREHSRAFPKDFLRRSNPVGSSRSILRISGEIEVSGNTFRCWLLILSSLFRGFVVASGWTCGPSSLLVSDVVGWNSGGGPGAPVVPRGWLGWSFAGGVVVASGLGGILAPSVAC